MIRFYEKHKKPILFFVGFVIFAILVGTVLNGNAVDMNINE